jgi:hypothetical protein
MVPSVSRTRAGRASKKREMTDRRFAPRGWWLIHIDANLRSVI